MGARVSRFSGTSWADYVEQRGLTFPEGQTWADVPAAEQRRLTRNWRRWQQRRMARRNEPLNFTLRGDTVVVED